MENKQLVITQQRVVMGEYLNDQGTLFGGYALKWMDEVAYISVRNLTGQRMVTVSADEIKFREAIPHGTILRITGRILTFGLVKTKVRTEIWMADQVSHQDKLAVEGEFTFAAVDQKGKPVRLSAHGNFTPHQTNNI